MTVIGLSALALVTGGCGSSGKSSSGGSPGSTTSPSSTSGSGAASGGAGVLSAEAKSAATGDIPDTQVFLVFHNSQAGYSIKYPEGWTQKSAGADATFSTSNNVVHIVLGAGGAPSTASMTAELTRLKASNPTLTFNAPTAVHLTVGPAFKSTYTTRSAPNPVTLKSVILIVHRYEFAHGGKRVTVDLGTPKGVDNVDAYRMMINSFTWR